MLKPFLVCTILLSLSLAVQAQDRRPRPSFFEEERRLTTPTNQEIREDQQTRQTEGFSATFLTDALSGVSDPGLATESRTSLTSVDITPNTPEPPAPSTPSFGIFVRPPASESSGIFVPPPASGSSAGSVTGSTTTLK
ncbi:MAG: hypothetical protein ACK421_01930 [Pseudanabaenaceae cyanobacterium]